jgi:hypothetical protein
MMFANPLCWITGQDYLVFCKRDPKPSDGVRRVVLKNGDLRDILDAEHGRMQLQVDALLGVAAHLSEKKFIHKLYKSGAFATIASSSTSSSSLSASPTGALVGIVTNKKPKKRSPSVADASPIKGKAAMHRLTTRSMSSVAAITPAIVS